MSSRLRPVKSTQGLPPCCFSVFPQQLQRWLISHPWYGWLRQWMLTSTPHRAKIPPCYQLGTENPALPRFWRRLPARRRRLLLSRRRFPPRGMSADPYRDNLSIHPLVVCSSLPSPPELQQMPLLPALDQLWLPVLAQAQIHANPTPPLAGPHQDSQNVTQCLHHGISVAPVGRGGYRFLG